MEVRQNLLVFISASIKLLDLTKLYLRKVGIHEGTDRDDLSQYTAPSSVYKMGRVAETSPLKGLHTGTCFTSK